MSSQILGEIENQLMSKSAAISQAVVIVGKPDALGSKQTLTAFLQFNDVKDRSGDQLLQLSDKLRLDLQNLEADAKSALANYMVYRP